jgi:hypothetical protein
MGIIFLIVSNDMIVFISLLSIYGFIILISLFVISILIKKNFDYKYIYFYDKYFTLVNKYGDYIDFNDYKIYVDNSILGILLSPYHLVFNYEIKYDFIIKDRQIEYTRIYFTLGEYLKLKKYRFSYIDFNSIK